VAASFVDRPRVRFCFAVSLVLFFAAAVSAIPVKEYHQQVKWSIKLLDEVSHAEESESSSDYYTRDIATVRRVRELLPADENVEFEGARFKVDNAWLHDDLNRYSKDTSQERYELLQGTIERLKALDERMTEVEGPMVAANSNAENSRKLAEILSRPEYARKVQEESALARLLERFLKWLTSWLPKPKPMAAGGASIISRIAEWVVIILALAVLGFVLKLILPRVLRGGRQKKKRKEKARIVLGERLEPDQSALDLLSEAEALARRGELRAAIRRAYIALLVELGDRKVISLAQYKTNRDYLRAMREIEPLYRNVKVLTDSFERHWYGLAQANESDWSQFRSSYNQALMR
jgi:uncharacterized small protein (DUF1192 family)